jgi:hypothetical protein
MNKATTWDMRRPDCLLNLLRASFALLVPVCQLNPCLGGPVTFQVEEGSSARGDIKTSSVRGLGTQCPQLIFDTFL